MVKILLGLVAAVVIAVGGFFGFEFYTQHRIVGEMVAAAEQFRVLGCNLTHGKLTFDLKSRTVTIADIKLESTTQPPVSIKIASVVASGVGQPGTERFSADSIEASDLEASVSIAGPAVGNLIYKVPRLVMKDYSGPATLQRPQTPASVIDAYRSVLEQFATVSASSITAPTMVGTISNFGTVTSADFNYTGIALRDVRNGKIASIQIERNAFAANTQQAGKPDKLTGEILNVVSRDFDAAAVAAILDPKAANDDKYYRVYGQTTAGPYTVTSAQGLRMRIDGISIDDVSGRPSRLQIPALLSLMPAAGATPTPAQAREMLEKVANIYEGMRIGTAEMHGISTDTPEGPFKLAAVRFNLENGKVGEFAIEGLDGRSSKGPVKVGRFALKSLDAAGLLRMAAQYSTLGQPPSPDQFLGMFPLLAGIDVKGVSVPFKNTGKPLNFEVFNLDWGQFVGPIPSKVRLVAKFSGPLDGPEYRMFLAAGMDKMAMNFDLGAAWDEASRSLTLEPGAFEISGLVKMSARVSLANVPRQLFSFNPLQAAAMAAQVEAGAIELTLRDLGVTEIAVAEYARTKNVSRDAARQGLIQEIRSSATTAANSPDAQGAVEALVRFVETPGTTLTLKLTPLGKVSAMQLFRLLQSNPLDALPQFRIETSTAL
jgi:hypothetical protein